jgi:hypothetical protein
MSNNDEMISHVNETQNKITQSLTRQKSNLELLNDKLNKVAEFAKNNYINKDLINELSNVSSTNNEMIENINVSLNDMLNHDAMSVPDESVPDESVPDESVLASESMDTYQPELIGDDGSSMASEIDEYPDDSDYQSSIADVPMEQDISRTTSGVSELTTDGYDDVYEEMMKNMNANPAEDVSSLDEDDARPALGGKYRKTRRRKNKSTKRKKGKSKKSRKNRRKTKRH